MGNHQQQKPGQQRQSQGDKNPSSTAQNQQNQSGGAGQQQKPGQQQGSGSPRHQQK